jgi:hypothetical protein
MRYLTPTYPAEFRRVILVESGPRAVLEAAIPRLTNVFSPQTSFHLVTCYSGNPSTLEPAATIWRTADHRSAGERNRLLEEIKATDATAIAIICSGHPIMTRWKWWLVWRLPVKVLVINENADCFWLDTAHVSNARRLALVRLGLSGEIAGRTLLRLALFPFGLIYLVLYASVVHAQRWFRLAFKS